VEIHQANASKIGIKNLQRMYTQTNTKGNDFWVSQAVCVYCKFRITVSSRDKKAAKRERDGLKIAHYTLCTKKPGR